MYSVFVIYDNDVSTVMRVHHILDGMNVHNTPVKIEIAKTHITDNLSSSWDGVVGHMSAKIAKDSPS